MKFLAIISAALVYTVVCEGDADAQLGAGTDQVLGLPYGYPGLTGLTGLTGPVSGSSVNVPGQFSYVVNSLHPTNPAITQFPTNPAPQIQTLEQDSVAENTVEGATAARLVPSWDIPAYTGYTGYNALSGYYGRYYPGPMGYYGGLNAFRGFPTAYGGYPYYG